METPERERYIAAELEYPYAPPQGMEPVELCRCGALRWGTCVRCGRMRVVVQPCEDAAAWDVWGRREWAAMVTRLFGLSHRAQATLEKVQEEPWRPKLPPITPERLQARVQLLKRGDVAVMLVFARSQRKLTPR